MWSGCSSLSCTTLENYVPALLMRLKFIPEDAAKISHIRGIMGELHPILLELHSIWRHIVEASWKLLKLRDLLEYVWNQCHLLLQVKLQKSDYHIIYNSLFIANF